MPLLRNAVNDLVELLKFDHRRSLLRTPWPSTYPGRILSC